MSEKLCLASAHLAEEKIYICLKSTLKDHISGGIIGSLVTLVSNKNQTHK